METLGIREDSIVMSIGTLFTPEGIDLSNPSEVKKKYGKMYILDIEDEEVTYGRRMDVSTIKWWLRQSQEILKEQMDDKNAVTMDKAVEDILSELKKNNFFGSYPENYIWSRGLFESKLWDSMVQDLEIEKQIMYWHWRDTRTACDVVGNKPNGGIEHIKGLKTHNPVDDCFLDLVRLNKLGIIK